MVTRRRRSEKITTQRTYPSVLGVQFASKRKEGSGRTEMEEEKRGVFKATISFDYKTFGQENDRDDKATAIVYKDDHTKMIFGHVCERKERKTRG